MNLIYISNTRIPSQKANTYQSMVMCESFAKQVGSVEFWYPNGRNAQDMDKIDEVYKFYSINKIFKIIKIKCLDSVLLHDIIKSYKLWFVIKSLSFAFHYILKLKKLDDSYIVFTRDILGLRVLSFAKRVGFIKQKIYFEAHIYHKSISKNSRDIDGLVVINNYLKELYKKDGLSNILVAHDGVKLDDYKTLELKKGKDKNIVYIGNLFAWKGVYTLVDSMRYLQEYKLIVVGGSSDTLPEFKEYVKNSGLKNIEIIGFVKKSDTLKYIDIADVLVLPNSAKDKMSYYTSPLKLFEYMASKRVIVASRLPSIEEVLEDKKNAILFKPDDSKDLADKIKWVFNNDCNEIIVQAYKDVQNYSWDKRAKNIIGWIKNYV